MTTNGTTPAGCPAWCQRHNPKDDPVDGGGDHATEPDWVPVTLLHRTIGTEDSHLDVVTSELVTVLVQPTNSAEPWIYVGQTEDSAIQVELSIGSARRVVRAIEEHLARL